MSEGDGTGARSGRQGLVIAIDGPVGAGKSTVARRAGGGARVRATSTAGPCIARWGGRRSGWAWTCTDHAGLGALAARTDVRIVPTADRPPRPGGRDRRHRSAPNARDGRGGLAGVDLSGGTRTDGRAAARHGVRGRCGDGRSRHRDRGLSRCATSSSSWMRISACGRIVGSRTCGARGQPPTRAPSARRSRGATPATAEREIAPLRPAADAIRIDSTALDAEGVVRRMLDEVAALRERDKS